jgi:hypothetical protein
MDTATLGLLLPVIASIHNGEEYHSFGQFKTLCLVSLNKKFHHKRIFLFALVILTFAITVISMTNYFYQDRAVQFMIASYF